MATSTVEDYIKAIYLGCRNLEENEMLQVGKLAQSLKVVPGTATTMVKSLHEAGLIEYEARVGVRLSQQGKVLALHVLRRHRLVELFLVEILKMDWSEIHEEAEQLEHVISDRVLEKIDALLGHPEYDPHGDPIPNNNGQVKERDLQNLVTSPINQQATIARIVDQKASFLQFAESKGLVPGNSITVLKRDHAANAIEVATPFSPSLTLGTEAALKIEVE